MNESAVRYLQHSPAGKPIDQATNIAMNHSHSQAGEPRTGIVSRLGTQQSTIATHFLESQGQALSAG